MTFRTGLLIAMSVVFLSCRAGAEEPVRSITQLTDNLYRAQDDIHFTVFLVTPDGIVLTDPISTEFSRWLRGELDRRFGVPVKYVLYSHHHWDHASGGAVFADTARFVGQENMLVHLAAPRPENLAQVRLPDITFRERTTVLLGGHPVEMTWTGPITHTDDMSVIRFPQEKVVFVVDFISIETMPYRTLGPQLFPEWVDAIRAVEAMDFEIVAPGHGVVGGRSDVAAHRRYLLDLRDAVSAGIQAGASLEAMRQDIRLEEYSGWFMYDAWREDNVVGMYRILSGKQ